MASKVLCGDMRYFAKWGKDSRLYLAHCTKGYLARDFLRTGYVEVNCCEYEELKDVRPNFWNTREPPARQMRLL